MIKDSEVVSVFVRVARQENTEAVRNSVRGDFIDMPDKIGRAVVLDSIVELRRLRQFIHPLRDT